MPSLLLGTPQLKELCRKLLKIKYLFPQTIVLTELFVVQNSSGHIKILQRYQPEQLLNTQVDPTFHIENFKN